MPDIADQHTGLLQRLAHDERGCQRRVISLLGAHDLQRWHDRDGLKK